MLTGFFVVYLQPSSLCAISHKTVLVGSCKIEPAFRWYLVQYVFLQPYLLTPLTTISPLSHPFSISPSARHISLFSPPQTLLWKLILCPSKCLILEVSLHEQEIKSSYTCIERDFPKMSHDTICETVFRFFLFLIRSLQSYEFTVNTGRIIETQNRDHCLITCGFLWKEQSSKSWHN